MFHKIKVKSQLCNIPCTSMVPDVDWVDWINSAFIWRLQRQNDFCLWDNVSLHLWYLPWPILLCAALPSFLNEPAIPSMPRLRPNHFKGWLPNFWSKTHLTCAPLNRMGICDWTIERSHLSKKLTIALAVVFMRSCHLIQARCGRRVIIEFATACLQLLTEI